MNFPHVDRVIYKTNPLDQVLCQFKFQPILKINTEPPATFQDEIRSLGFSNYSLDNSFNIQLNTIRRENLSPIDISNHISHVFSSGEEQGKQKIVHLTSESLSLTSQKYSRWEEFLSDFNYILDIFNRIYDPVVITRIGLRYTNLIDRNKLGFSQASTWGSLVNKNILGLINDSTLEPFISGTLSVSIIDLEEQVGKLRLQTQLVEQDDVRKFIIDSDIFAEERLSHDEAIHRLNIFNGYIRRIFRYCITTQLHEALEPNQP